jgi:hypothetical protein
MLNTWGPYFYTYGIGGLIFLVTMIIIVRTGALNLAPNRDRWLFGALIAGLVAFCFFHGIWIYLALRGA